MPLPKGIYSDPELRQAWIMERQSVVDEYDRLLEDGLSTRRAAKQLGYRPSRIEEMRGCLERMAEVTTGRTKGERIDLGLALLNVANPPGPERQVLSAHDMAAWCGCSPAAIQRIKQAALRKLHRKLNALLREQVIHGDFGEAIGDTLGSALHPLAAAA